MPSDREVRDRRRQAIREILRGGEPVADQRSLVSRLRGLGFAATQSNVSRDLRDVGAVRHEGRYLLPSWTQSDDSPFRQIVPFLRKVSPAGPHQIFLGTAPGAGAMVAQAIEDDEWPDLVGTVEGHSSVLLLTDGPLAQKQVHQRIRHYLALESVTLEGAEGEGPSG